MHLKQVRIFPQRFPTRERYPFNLDIFNHPNIFKFTKALCRIQTSIYKIYKPERSFFRILNYQLGLKIRNILPRTHNH